jgi:hypothetical protein
MDFMDFHRFLMIFIVFLLIFIDLHRFSWIFIDFHRFSWIYMDFFSFSWISMVFSIFERFWGQGAWRPVPPCAALWPPVAACGGGLDPL